MATLLFDVYGTLVDPAGMAGHLEAEAGAQSGRLAAQWREKQLEYTFRRGLMGRYRDFEVCTAQALDHAAATLGVTIGKQRRAQLLAAYFRLPAFVDAAPALRRLRSGHALHAFSNGTPRGVSKLLKNAGLLDLLESVISVDTVASYKPDPQVYRHALAAAGSAPEDAWLISANAFDALGARHAGINSVWVRRSRQVVPDPWELRPTAVVESLDALDAAVAGAEN